MRKANITKANSTQELLEWEMQYLQEQITCLAEDIIDLNEGQDDLINWANLCVDNYNAALELDDIDKNFSALEDRCSLLDNKIEQVDNAWWYLFLALLVWNIILSIVLACYVF